MPNESSNLRLPAVSPHPQTIVACYPLRQPGDARGWAFRSLRTVCGFPLFIKHILNSKPNADGIYRAPAGLVNNGGMEKNSEPRNAAGQVQGQRILQRKPKTGQAALIAASSMNPLFRLKW